MCIRDRLVISMVLHLLMGLLDIIGRIPVIHGINKVAGLGVGLLKGMVIVWICCLTVSYTHLWWIRTTLKCSRI